MSFSSAAASLFVSGGVLSHQRRRLLSSAEASLSSAASSSPSDLSFLFSFFIFLFVLSFSRFFSQELELFLRRKKQFPILVSDFDPIAAAARFSSREQAWIDLQGRPSPPPDYNSLPLPAEVLAGRALPAWDGLRLRDQKAFFCGSLHRFADEWDKLMVGVDGFDVVRPWIRGGVDIPSFFQPFRGPFGKSRFFDSDIPPPMCFQNAPVCAEFVKFISDTICLRLEEGSMRYLGRVGVDDPPRVVNALSVEPTKPRLILSMRAVNLYCRDTPFSLTPLSDIVRNIPAGGYFSSYDDVQGYKHLALTEASVPFCGFEWGGYWFCDTTLPFGWKNSAYVYTTTGEVLSSFLRARGINTSLWIDDRFLGAVPAL